MAGYGHFSRESSTGNCHIKISDIEFAPGAQVDAVLMSEEDPTLPLMVDGKHALLKVFLAVSNPKRSLPLPASIATCRHFWPALILQCNLVVVGAQVLQLSFAMQTPYAPANVARMSQW